MKRVNDGENTVKPMFPRLHINDTGKGGPRAPPRNKMALYEQLSIPSQRFNHGLLPHNLNNSSLPPSSSAGGNKRGMFFARQVHTEKQYSEFSTPQVKERKKMDEDDYMVPIFIQPIDAEFDKYNSPEKLSPSNTPYFHPSLKFQKSNEISIGQEGGSNKGENSSESAAEQTVSSISHEQGDTLANSVNILTADGSERLEVCAESRLHRANMVRKTKRKSSNSEESCPSLDQNIFNDLSNDTGSYEDGSCRPPQIGNLERVESVSETSILDTELALDITPDDVVGVLGQKQFWKARKAIMNQQRVLAVQLFELHRLIKVQRLIAASPHLLLEESTYSDKSTKPLISKKKRPLDYAISEASENPSQKKERSAENTVYPSPQHGVPPSTCRQSAGTTPAPSNEPTSRFNHPQSMGQQWLIPMMSPSEGLIYKPCPPPAMGNFLPPVYGAPLTSPQYPFPPYGPHGYFPYHSMPNMTSAAFGGSSDEMEVQGSSAGSPTGREVGSRVRNGVEERNAVHIFSTTSALASDASKLEGRVIKVVPRNGVSASESAARIFRSIQEGRKQNDSV